MRGSVARGCGNHAASPNLFSGPMTKRALINAFGVHNYFGGFPLGVAKHADVNVHGSLETWEPAVTWAPKVGVNVWRGKVPAAMNLVFGNPPCSRFSHMSFSKFDDEDREDLSKFDDLIDVLEVGRETGAEMVWVENGPLMFSRGDSLLAQFRDVLGWDPYILVLKVNARQCGLPQDRPRTHVFIAKRPFPEMNMEPLLWPTTVWDFMRVWNSEYEFEGVPSSQVEDPITYAAMQQDAAVFLSTRPKVIDENDAYTYSMVSSRHFAWLQQERWWTVDEYAAVQGYPAGNGFDYAEPGVAMAMALISKSVSPTVSSWLTSRVVLPYFDSAPRAKHAKVLKYDLTAFLRGT